MKSITIFCLVASALAEPSSTFVSHDASKLALNNKSQSLLREQDAKEQVPLGETNTTTLREEVPCKHPPYQMHIFSKSPLVVYLSGFLTEFERSYLMNVSEGTFVHSGVVATTNGSSRIDHKVRSSDSAVLSLEDDVVLCIEERAAEFQGLDMDIEQLETTQMVRYAKGNRYVWHTDWFPQDSANTINVGGNRISSFFVYVDVGPGTLGGGTNFPVLDAPADRRWCDRGYIDCDDEWESGVTFSPLPGNGVFWENLENDGSRRGDHRVLHAGLPVLRGTKMGMNIWTREHRLL